MACKEVTEIWRSSDAHLGDVADSAGQPVAGGVHQGQVGGVDLEVVTSPAQFGVTGEPGQVRQEGAGVEINKST